jgi:octaprenyl-diphosphate synthase
MSSLAANNFREGQSNLFSLLGQEIKQVEQLINQQTQNSVGIIELASNNLIGSGGKRIRPTLTLATSKLLGNISSDAIHLAAAVEMIHNATLLHDDVIDHAEFRRGSRTSNILWGNTASVLVGDYLFAKAFELMIHANNMKVLNTLAKASSMVAQGEVHQLSAKHNIKLSLDEYLKIIGAKTASLFAASSEVGALVASCDEPQQQACHDFGYNMGIAFQIIDDMLDYRIDLQNLGKPYGNDMREGKITLPVILAVQLGAEISFWENAFTNQVDNTEHSKNVETAYAILKSFEIFSTCQTYVDHYSSLAIQSLEALPNNIMQKALIEFVSYQQHRLQ